MNVLTDQDRAIFKGWEATRDDIENARLEVTRWSLFHDQRAYLIAEPPRASSGDRWFYHWEESDDRTRGSSKFFVLRSPAGRKASINDRSNS